MEGYSDGTIDRLGRNHNSRGQHICRCRLIHQESPDASHSYSWTSRRRKGWNATMTTEEIVHRRNRPKSSNFTWHYRMRLVYSWPLLAGAVEATFSLTAGAGAFSLSPKLSFICTVPFDAPAFQLATLAAESFGWIRDEIKLQRTLQGLSRQLKQLYIDGKGSPRDVNPDGNTVMHVRALFRLLSFCSFLTLKAASMPG